MIVITEKREMVFSHGEHIALITLLFAKTAP